MRQDADKGPAADREKAEPEANTAHMALSAVDWLSHKARPLKAQKSSICSLPYHWRANTGLKTALSSDPNWNFEDAPLGVNLPIRGPVSFLIT